MDPDLRASRRLLLSALLAGLVVAGLPAAYVVRAGGSPAVVVLLVLLALLPAGLALLIRRPVAPRR